MTLSPSDFGFNPQKFPSFRSYQLESALNIAENACRFTVLSGPTGTGKTLLYMLASKLMPSTKRTAILTVTRELQYQLKADFHESVEIMGMSHYECLKDGDTCDTGSCLSGYHCTLRGNGCTFYDQVRRAKKAETIISNYAFWHYGSDLGKFDFLILDEVHKLLPIMTQMLELRLNDREFESIKHQHPELSDTSKIWIESLRDLCAKLTTQRHLKNLPPHESLRLSNLSTRILEVANLMDESPRNWIKTDLNGYGAKSRWHKKNTQYPSKGILISPKWPGMYAEKILFNNIPKILLVSATVTKASVHFLGIGKDFTFLEIPSTFPVENRRFIFLDSEPRISIDYKTNAREFRVFMQTKIDPFIKMFGHMNGIIHARSYYWAERILKTSEFSNQMLSNKSSRDLGGVVKRFRDSPNPHVLVSPSLESGYNFLGCSCRWQIILKVPFPDNRTDLQQIRQRSTGFSETITMDSLMQTSGRSTRSAVDWSLVAIFDNHFANFWAKNRKYAVKYFSESVEVLRVIPDPQHDKELDMDSASINPDDASSSDFGNAVDCLATVVQVRSVIWRPFGGEGTPDKYPWGLYGRVRYEPDTESGLPDIEQHYSMGKLKNIGPTDINGLEIVLPADFSMFDPDDMEKYSGFGVTKTPDDNTKWHSWAMNAKIKGLVIEPGCKGLHEAFEGLTGTFHTIDFETNFGTKKIYTLDEYRGKKTLAKGAKVGQPSGLKSAILKFLTDQPEGVSKKEVQDFLRSEFSGTVMVAHLETINKVSFWELFPEVSRANKILKLNKPVDTDEGWG